MIQSISILSSSCPLFNLLDISLALWDNLMGEALIFIFHWAAIDHIISKDNPNELLSEASRGLIYIPSVLVVGLEAALRVAVSVEYLILENPYTNSATRSQGCSDVNQGTFVCAITPSKSTYNTLRLSLFIVQTLSILLIIFYCVVAWKRLAKQVRSAHEGLRQLRRRLVFDTRHLVAVVALAPQSQRFPPTLYLEHHRHWRRLLQYTYCSIYHQQRRGGQFQPMHFSFS